MFCPVWPMKIVTFSINHLVSIFYISMECHALVAMPCTSLISLGTYNAAILNVGEDPGYKLVNT